MEEKYMKNGNKQSKKKQIMAARHELDKLYSDYYKYSDKYYPDQVEYVMDIPMRVLLVFALPITLMGFICRYRILFADEFNTILTCIYVGIPIFVFTAQIMKCSNVKKNGVILLIFYSQHNLDKINAQIAKVKPEVEKQLELHQAKLRRQMEEEAERARIAEEKRLQEAKRLRPEFDILFGIIETELRGSVRPETRYDKDGKPYDSETSFMIKLPFLDYDEVRTRDEAYRASERDLRRLAIAIAKVYPELTKYYALQKLLDAAVPAEQ